MPHDPSSYGAAPRPGHRSTDPYSNDLESMRTAADHSPWAPVATAADHAHPHAAPGLGRRAPGTSWTSVRSKVGATLHGLVRIGRWLLLPLIVMFVVGVVLHSRMSDGATDVPLDGTPVTIQVERGSDVWLWAPEEAPAVSCAGTDSAGLGLEPRWLLRQLTNDDHVSTHVMPSGSTGTFEIVCEPAEEITQAAPQATEHVRVAQAPSARALAAYYLLARASTLGSVVVAAATAVLWIVWGILRAARVLPRLR